MKHRLEYAAVRAVMALVSVLPDGAVQCAGAWLGRMAYALDAHHRRVALTNLAAALPAKTDAERRAITKGALDRKSTRLNSSHVSESRMPSSA